MTATFRWMEDAGKRRKSIFDVYHFSYLGNGQEAPWEEFRCLALNFALCALWIMLACYKTCFSKSREQHPRAENNIQEPKVPSFLCSLLVVPGLCCQQHIHPCSTLPPTLTTELLLSTSLKHSEEKQMTGVCFT